MAKKSAGIIMYRYRDDRVEVLLVHPGGPFWAKKDSGAWSIPKGEYEEGEDPVAVARREFEEETGFPVTGEFLSLAPIKQPSGKVVSAWAVKGECDITALRSNCFSLEWPPRSGLLREFPEVDRAGWFTIQEAYDKLLKGQRPLLDQLCRMLAIKSGT